MTDKKTPLAPGMDAVDAAIAMKADLLEKIEKLGDKLPPNTIDELIDSFGGPEAVAEVGTRKSASHLTQTPQHWDNLNFYKTFFLVNISKVFICMLRLW